MSTWNRDCLLLFYVAASGLISATHTPCATREVLLIAGPPSHPPLQHEQNAAAILLARILNTVPGIHATTSQNGWPQDPELVRRADAIWIFCNGADGHLLAQGGHAAEMQAAAGRGAGIMFYHFATEPPERTLHEEFLDWTGGYFELNYSVNPIFTADFKTLPRHPITRGVLPFSVTDEWYYNMRFRKAIAGITQLLVTIPPASSLSRPDGPREGNSDVRSKIGQPQCLMWAYERPGGGRGVGFTGGHFHMNLGNENFRRLILNALVWLAKGNVPSNGVESQVTRDDLMENLDKKEPR
jgi:hypothetical protein